jgi:hypothetical protein
MRRTAVFLLAILSAIVAAPSASHAYINQADGTVVPVTTRLQQCLDLSEGTALAVDAVADAAILPEAYRPVFDAVSGRYRVTFHAPFMPDTDPDEDKAIFNTVLRINQWVEDRIREAARRAAELERQKMAAEEGKRIYGDVIPPTQAGRRIIVLKQPIGVVAAITPWNFPHQINLAKIGPALAAGNTLVLKPAPDTPWCAAVLGELAERTDLPPGLADVVLRAMAVEPSDRYDSADALSAALVPFAPSPPMVFGTVRAKSMRPSSDFTVPLRPPLERAWAVYSGVRLLMGCSLSMPPRSPRGACG